VHALGLFAATLHKRLAHTPDEPLARNMMRAIDGLERSFNAMLDISRLDAGVMTPRLQTFPLRDMFRRLHMHYAGQAELAGLGLRFSPGGKSVTSDPQLLERIVGNLIQNAIKYTERGGIVVLARSTRTHVNVEIWDTGSGIAPEVLPRIFEEFLPGGPRRARPLARAGHGPGDRQAAGRRCSITGWWWPRDLDAAPCSASASRWASCRASRKTWPRPTPCRWRCMARRWCW
jgi:signal transduction histidine kinase